VRQLFALFAQVRTNSLPIRQLFAPIRAIRSTSHQFAKFAQIRTQFARYSHLFAQFRTNSRYSLNFAPIRQLFAPIRTYSLNFAPIRQLFAPAIRIYNAACCNTVSVSIGRHASQVGYRVNRKLASISLYTLKIGQRILACHWSQSTAKI